jgi:hypothetical protein
VKFANLSKGILIDGKEQIFMFLGLQEAKNVVEVSDVLDVKRHHQIDVAMP